MQLGKRQIKNKGDRNHKKDEASQEENEKNSVEGRGRNSHKRRGHDRNRDGENRQGKDFKQNRQRQNQQGGEQNVNTDAKAAPEHEKEPHQKNRFRRFRGNGKRDGKGKGGDNQS